MRLLHLGIACADDVRAGELGGEADHEATEGLVAMEGAVVGAEALGGWGRGSGGEGRDAARASGSGRH